MAAAVAVVVIAAVVDAVDLLRSRLYLKVVADSAICVVDSNAAVGVLIMRLRTLSTGRRDTLAPAPAAAAAVAAAAAAAVPVDVAAAGEAAVCVRSCRTQVDHPSVFSVGVGVGRTEVKSNEVNFNVAHMKQNKEANRERGVS